METMDRVENDELRQLAEKFRAAILHARTDFPDYLRGKFALFPKQCCGFASVLLALHLKSNQRAQFDRVRRICLSIASTIEKTSHGEPTFFTPKRVFAMFANNHHGDGHVAMWVPAAAGV
jgi:hypothetical protein